MSRIAWLVLLPPKMLHYALLVQVQAMLDTYGAKYRSLKAPRKLQWKPSLGTVSLELAIGDQTLEFSVSFGFVFLAMGVRCSLAMCWQRSDVLSCLAHEEACLPRCDEMLVG